MRRFCAVDAGLEHLPVSVSARTPSITEGRLLLRLDPRLVTSVQYSTWMLFTVCMCVLRVNSTPKAGRRLSQF